MQQKTLAEFKATKAADILKGQSFEVLADGEYIGTFVVAIPGIFDPRYRVNNIATQMDQARGLCIEWKPDPVPEQEDQAAVEDPEPEEAEDDVEQVQETPEVGPADGDED